MLVVTAVRGTKQLNRNPPHTTINSIYTAHHSPVSAVFFLLICAEEHPFQDRPNPAVSNVKQARYASCNHCERYKTT